MTLIPTTIGGLLSAIGIAGMDRLVQRNVLAMSGRAVEAAGDIDTLLLDKTGTITFGNRLAAEFVPGGRAQWRRARRGGGSLLARSTRRPKAARSSTWRGRSGTVPPMNADGEFAPFTRGDAHERPAARQRRRL